MKKSIETLVNEYNDFKIDKLTLVKGIYKAMNVSIRSRNNLKLFPKLYKKYNLENMSYVPEKELNDIMEDNTLIAAIDLIRSDSDHIRTIYISNYYEETKEEFLVREEMFVSVILITMILLSGGLHENDVIYVSKGEFNIIDDIQEIAALLMAPVPLLTKFEQKFFRVPHMISVRYYLTERLSNYIFNKYLK